MKIKLSLALILSTLSFSVFSHSQDEAVAMVKAGHTQNTEIIIKYKKAFDKGVYNFWKMNENEGFSENALIKNKIEERSKKERSIIEKLKTYHQLNLKKELSQDQAIEVLQNLYTQENVEYAYFSPKVVDAIFLDGKTIDPQDKTEKETPNLEEKQDYLNDAPVGIGARSAWEIPGGTGKNVKIIDIETGINSDHEDFNSLFHLGELPSGKVDHGTAVWGELNAKKDDKGITGIAHEAGYGFKSRLEQLGGDTYESNMAKVIGASIDMLEKGDVIVLEMHSPGPSNAYIPVEYWEPVFDVVKLASERGIFCVAAGGNGYEDLDKEIYKNAFNLETRNSNCIIVGAALKTKEKADFSNYGSRIDAFGYGRDVVTAGYGDLFNGGPGRKYTASFSGTSSATPIVAGAVAIISSIAKENGVEITPAQMRDALRGTGDKQKNQTGVQKRIGSFPNIVELLQHLNL